MAFHFPLHAVLHFRQSIEHQQELRLRAANQQVTRVQHLTEQIDARRQEIYAAQSKELGTGVTAAELRFELQCEAELLRHRGELAGQLVRLKQLREEQREIFQQARRAREMLEGVRDQQLRLYQQKAARREQRNQDDLFLLRREYLRRG
ncbi:MAG: flagellar FliJ family protein [Candidatus Sulfotelmatobacter sp.]|jgi:flagellar export protein FliJ